MTFLEHRKNLGMTQKQLADLLQIGRTTISMWETKKAAPQNVGLLVKIAKIFKIDINDTVSLFNYK